jgi:VCBS repeat-containing protein
MPSLRLETEKMLLGVNYAIENQSFASEGGLIRLNGSTGTATATFTGATGLYDVVVGYYDESDGESQLTVNIGGTTLDSWAFSDSPGGTRASSQNFTLRTIATGISITNGSEIELIGVLDDGEVARVDYIEFIPVGSPNQAPIAQVDAYAATEDTVLTVPVENGVLSNDSDPEADSLTVTAYDAVSTANGTVVMTADGAFTYTPTMDFAGTDSFTYTVSDGVNAVSQTVTVNVNPVNDAPVGNEDSLSTGSGTPLTFWSVELLANDSDIDGDALSLESVTQPANGTVTDNNDGTFTYTPNANFSGIDSFSYVVTDGTTSSAPVPVNVSVDFVNTAPIATADDLVVDEDGSLVIAVTDLLTNDSDGDGHSLTWESFTQPPNGTLVDNNDGTLTYTPTGEFNGTDSFTYTINDGFGETATATVTITVNSVNDAPLATADAVSTPQDNPLVIATATLLGNDTDIDGDPLSVDSVGNPANGTLTDVGNGSYTYTPNAGFTGTDSFTYTVTDGNGGTDTATVTVTVMPPPPVNPDPIRLEAEAMSLSGGYQIETKNFASNGGMIGLTGATGTASTTFTGVTGLYDVVVGYYDESDGESQLTVNVGGTTLDSWNFTDNPGGSRAEASNFTLRTIAAGVTITNGSLIELIGVQDAGENSRTDYIEFIPAGPPPPDTEVPTADLTANALFVELGSAQDYVFTVTYSDNVSIDTATLDNNDVRVLGPNGFSQLAQLVSVDQSENGTPRSANYSITPVGGSWDAIAMGTYNVQVEPNQVTDLAGNAVATETLGSFQVLQAISSDDTTANYSTASHGVILNLDTSVALSPVFGALDNPRIMPLGDSITAGQHSIGAVPGGYRIQFWERAVADGLSLDFVGGQQNGPSSLGDKNHEGHPGYSIGQIKSNVNGWLATAPADVILLMIGTNDAFGGTDGPTLRNRLSDLIDEIDQVSPDSYLIVSSITPLDGPRSNDTENAEVTKYNNLIPTLVNDKFAEGKRVFYANAGGSLTRADMNGTNSATSPTNDGIHPTEEGYDKLGDAWYDEVFNPESLAGKSNLIGSGFSDRLIGNAGSNVLEGGAGEDELTGNGGSDTFFYRTSSHGADTITDFGTDDVIQISTAGFGGGLVAGMVLNASNFVSGTNPTATGTGATFLFNTSTNTLGFDVDGTGGATAQAIATFANGHNLQANEVAIIA